MALVLDLSKNQSIEVVPFIDDSLDMTREEYEAYLENVSEVSLLNFKPGKTIEDCTRFIVRKFLTFDDQQKIMSMQMKVEVDQETKKSKISSNISYIIAEARLAIVGIKSPGDNISALQYKKDNDGYLNRDICAQLHQAGVLSDIYNARQNLTQAADKDLKKN